MRDPELDRILSAEEELVPSSGFVRNVMDAVRLEASAPPPIPFPWKRALPGLVLCGLAVIAACGMALLRSDSPRVPQTLSPSIFSTVSSGLSELFHAANASGLSWIILALLLTLVSVKLSLRLTGGSS